MPENDSLPCFECNPYDINCITLDTWGDVKVLDLKNSACRACKFWQRGHFSKLLSSGFHINRNPFNYKMQIKTIVIYSILVGSAPFIFVLRPSFKLDLQRERILKIILVFHINYHFMIRNSKITHWNLSELKVFSS